MNLKSQCSAWWNFTGKVDKTLVFIELASALILLAIGLIQLDLFAGLFGINLICLAYATFRADLYHALWNGAAQLTSLGMRVTEALHEHTFLHVFKADDTYYIQPEQIHTRDDDDDDSVYTDEIVIRRGLDSDGGEITAYRVPKDMAFRDVIGLLEATKLYVVRDSLEGNHE